MELPQYRVEAATREQALLILNQLLVQRLDKVEVIPMEIKLPQTEQSRKPWMKFAGVFKDDPDFDIVQQYIQEYRQELDATEYGADIWYAQGSKLSLWILDTDCVSVFQRGNLEIARRLNIIDANEVAITIVTVEEQLRGRFQVYSTSAS